MKPKELKDLFLRSLTSELADHERSILNTELVKDHGFREGFSDRILSGIAAGSIFIKSNRELLRSFDNIFLKVALTGAAAIIILIMSILIGQGSLDYDALIGIDNQADGVLLSLLAD